MSEPTQTQTYRNPALTVDALVARRRESQDQSDTLSSDDATAMTSTDTVEVLLIQRGRAPFAGCWAFPGMCFMIAMFFEQRELTWAYFIAHVMFYHALNDTATRNVMHRYFHY